MAHFGGGVVATGEQHFHLDLEKLRATGRFDGGSSIGDGECVAKAGQPPGITAHLAGYIRVRAETLEAAKQLLHGNPTFEAGGTVEIRELPRE